MRSLAVWTVALLASAVLGLGGYQLLAQPAETDPVVTDTTAPGTSGTAVPQAGTTAGSDGTSERDSDQDYYDDDDDDGGEYEGYGEEEEYGEEEGDDGEGDD